MKPVLPLVCCVQVSRTPASQNHPSLPRQASEKRQGTKSRAGRSSVLPLRDLWGFEACERQFLRGRNYERAALWRVDRFFRERKRSSPDLNPRCALQPHGGDHFQAIRSARSFLGVRPNNIRLYRQRQIPVKLQLKLLQHFHESVVISDWQPPDAIAIVAKPSLANRARCVTGS